MQKKPSENSPIEKLKRKFIRLCSKYTPTTSTGYAKQLNIMNQKKFSKEEFQLYMEEETKLWSLERKELAETIYEIWRSDPEWHPGESST